MPCNAVNYAASATVQTLAAALWAAVATRISGGPWNAPDPKGTTDKNQMHEQYTPNVEVHYGRRLPADDTRQKLNATKSAFGDQPYTVNGTGADCQSFTSGTLTILGVPYDHTYPRAEPVRQPDGSMSRAGMPGWTGGDSTARNLLPGR